MLEEKIGRIRQAPHQKVSLTRVLALYSKTSPIKHLPLEEIDEKGRSLRDEIIKHLREKSLIHPAVSQIKLGKKKK